MKTIKQIADEIGIDKQKVYRYVKKNHINDVHQKDGVMYIDDVVETIIYKEFDVNDAHHDVHQNHINDAVDDVLVEILKKELDSKNEQILNMQKLLDQEQQLRMIVEQKNILLEEKIKDDIEPQKEDRIKEKLSFWQRIFAAKK